jgi:RNA polymerase sigma-70 factor (ECF subfamily)
VASPQQQPQKRVNLQRPPDVEFLEKVDTDDEKVWVEKARAGNQSGWAELHRMYYIRLRGLVNQICADEALAEDIVQETFIKAYKKIGKFRGDSKFSTWIYRIAVNQTYDALRKRNRLHKWLGWHSLHSPHEEEDSLIHDIPAPEYDLHEHERGDQRKAIEEALASLSPEHRAVVELRLVQGLSTEETAEALGCKKGTVLSRLYYSCQKLQRLLRKSYEELG